MSDEWTGGGAAWFCTEAPTPPRGTAQASVLLAIERAQRARLARQRPRTPVVKVSGRFAAVRFYPPGVPPVVTIYDRNVLSHLLAWAENQALYASQVVWVGDDLNAAPAGFGLEGTREVENV